MLPGRRRRRPTWTARERLRQPPGRPRVGQDPGPAPVTTLDGHRLAAADAPTQGGRARRRAQLARRAHGGDRGHGAQPRGVHDRALRVGAAAQRGDRHARTGRPCQDDPRGLLGADRRARVVGADASAGRRQQVGEAQCRRGIRARPSAAPGTMPSGARSPCRRGSATPAARTWPGSATDESAIGEGRPPRRPRRRRRRRSPASRHRRPCRGCPSRSGFSASDAEQRQQAGGRRRARRAAGAARAARTAARGRPGSSRGGGACARSAGAAVVGVEDVGADVGAARACGPRRRASARPAPGARGCASRRWLSPSSLASSSWETPSSSRRSNAWRCSSGSRARSSSSVRSAVRRSSVAPARHARSGELRRQLDRVRAHPRALVEAAVAGEPVQPRAQLEHAARRGAARGARATAPLGRRRRPGRARRRRACAARSAPARRR